MTTPEQRAHWRALAAAAQERLAGYRSDTRDGPDRDRAAWEPLVVPISAASIDFYHAAREAVPLLLADRDRLDAAIHEALAILDPPAGTPASERDVAAIAALALGLGGRA